MSLDWYEAGHLEDLYVPGVPPQSLEGHELQLYSGTRCTLSFPYDGQGMQSNVPDEGHHVTLPVVPIAQSFFLQGEHLLSVKPVHATDSYV